MTAQSLGALRLTIVYEIPSGSDASYLLASPHMVASSWSDALAERPVSPNWRAPQPTPEPVAQADAPELRKAAHDWHSRAVALGADGVEDVIRAAEIAKRRHELRTVDGFISEWKFPRESEPVALQGRDDGFDAFHSRYVMTEPVHASRKDHQLAAWRAARASLPAGGVVETIGKLLARAMDEAASNGANSVSMPDEYVELAAWLHCTGVATPRSSETQGRGQMTVRPLTRKELSDCCGGCASNSAIETWMRRAIAKFCEVNGIPAPQDAGGAPA